MLILQTWKQHIVPFCCMLLHMSSGKIWKNKISINLLTYNWCSFHLWELWESLIKLYFLILRNLWWITWTNLNFPLPFLCINEMFTLQCSFSKLSPFMLKTFILSNPPHAWWRLPGHFLLHSVLGFIWGSWPWEVQ